MSAAEARQREQPAMNRAWLLLWGLVIWQLAAWTYAPARPPPQVPAGDGKAFGSNEPYIADARESERQGALKALDAPTGSLCTEAGRKQFIRGLNEYYYHRQNQAERYPEIHGKPGADYIATQWSGPDDKRIDRLTQEAYSKGYLTPAEFDGVARKMVATVIKDERIIGSGCAG